MIKTYGLTHVAVAVRDVLVFEEKPKQAGKIGGVVHFGFRLQDPKDIGAAAKAVKKARRRSIRNS
jgi:hypothetical protein